MADKIVGKVDVELSAEDQELLLSLLEDSPFPKNLLLRLALRIGMKEIRKDPAVLLPYVAKPNPPA
ncbi:MAG: hypothetical protein D6731_04525 [Planctomycetota bacterium]|nr:MAG: hypothetical protein D6731_04525 [Planctomycetota bacterium]